MKTTTVITVLGAAGSAMAASSLIPTGISSSCSTHLAKLDQEQALSACTSAVSGATKAFAPGATGGDVAGAISGLCSANVASACSESYLRTTLGEFYQACTDELTKGANDKVKLVYDVLYTLAPLRTAACGTNASGATCGGVSSGAASAKTAQKFLGSPTGLNVTTWQASNAAFLFLSTALTNTDCNDCTRQTVQTYIKWENSIPYAPGIAASTLLKGQSDVFKAVTGTCGADFLNDKGVQAAGNAADSIVGKSSSAAVSAKTSGLALVATLVFGAVALF